MTTETFLFCPVCAARIRPLRPATGDTYTLRADEQAVCTCGAIFGEGDTLDTTCPICDGEGRIPADGCGELAGGWADPCDCTTNPAGGRESATRATFAAIEAAGGRVECDEDGYSLTIDGDYCGTHTTIEALAQAFAEREAGRIEAAYDRADGALDLVAELRAENERLRAALIAARALIHTIDRDNPGGYTVGAILLACNKALEASHA